MTFIRCPWLSVPSLPSQQIPRSHIINIILTVFTAIIIIIIIWSSIVSHHLVQISNCFCLVSERAVPIVSLLHQFHPGFGLSTICLRSLFANDGHYWLITNGHTGSKRLLRVLWIVLITIHIMQMYNNQTSWNRTAISINQQDSSRTFKTIFW